MKNLTTAILALTLASSAAWAVEERPSTSREQTAMAVTIYNNNLALVKDARRVRLSNGDNLIAWRDVSAQIRPETALLRSLDGKDIRLLEQNFDFDLLTPQSLLEKSVGQSVRVIRPTLPTGVDGSEYPVLISANSGFVLKYGDRVEAGLPQNGRLAFNGVPPGLRDSPTLSMLFKGQHGDQGMELSYLTSGLGWKADYVAELSSKEDRIDLNGWVTLTNTSGAAYPNALLQLIAGDVNQVQPERPMPMMKARMMAEAAVADMQEESLFEYHLYTLDRPTTLLDKQTKQVALLSAQQVPTSKNFVLNGADYYYQGQYGDLGQKMKPSVLMTFANKGGDLGIALPKGIVRVYKRDSAGRAQFVGEDRIEHTAKNETVELKLGEAFDITADKKQTEFNKLAAYGGRGGTFDTAYQLEIRNAKNEAVTVKVIEPMPGEWQILAESQAHTRENAHTAVWNVTVPAEGKTVLNWKARVRY